MQATSAPYAAAVSLIIHILVHREVIIFNPAICLKEKPTVLFYGVMKQLKNSFRAQMHSQLTTREQLLIISAEVTACARFWPAADVTE